jgi:hypothetical protein
MSNVISNPRPDRSAKQPKMPVHRRKQGVVKRLRLATKDPRRKGG